MNQRAFIGLIALTMTGLPSTAASSAAPYDGADIGPPADILALRNVEVTFHTAGSVLPQKALT